MRSTAVLTHARKGAEFKIEPSTIYQDYMGKYGLKRVIIALIVRLYRRESALLTQSALPGDPQNEKILFPNKMNVL